MREQTMSLEAHAGDRISSEFLASTLYRRAQSLIDDPTSSLLFGRIDQLRSDVGTTVCVQGAPGTGKTAVGLHRAAWLLCGPT